MRKAAVRGIHRRRRPTMVSIAFFGAIGIVALGSLDEVPTASYANANCGGHSLAGRWVNTAAIDSADVVSATIVMPCAPSNAPLTGINAPKIELGLTVRCLHVLSCEWQPVAASASGQAGELPRLKAQYDQQSFDRTVTIEPTDAAHLRLTLTSRFKGLGVGSVETTYTLERAKG